MFYRMKLETFHANCPKSWQNFTEQHNFTRVVSSLAEYDARLVFVRDGIELVHYEYIGDYATETYVEFSTRDGFVLFSLKYA